MYFQQTFVLMNTSWRRLSSSSSEDVLIKTNILTLLIRLQKMSSRRLDQDQYIRLSYTSSSRLQDVFKTSSRRLQDVLQKGLQGILKTSSRRFQDAFKTSSRSLAKTFSKRLQNVLKTSCKNIFNTSLRRLQDVLQRSLQDLFKMFHWVNLFLLTRFQGVFETFSKRS